MHLTIALPPLISLAQVFFNYRTAAHDTELAKHCSAMDTPSSSNGPRLSKRPKACPREECKICVWRNIVLPGEQGDMVDECHTPLAILQLYSKRAETNKLIMFAMHEEPPTIWKEICSTETLQSGSPFLQPNDHRSWFRFPLRNMRPMSLEPSFHFQTQTDFVDDYEGRRVHRDEDGHFTMYHYTKLEQLVRPSEKSEGSGGILNDGGMRYGCMHGDGIGVYCHASRPYELFSGGDGWVMLELRCHGNLTRVKGGSRGRYVIKSDQTSESEGAHCTDCEVVAMLHLYESLPNFMKV